eukprot:GFKZ01004941.1.p1 GENE.GFKZ01004941.1~~GFKZ01004941.1.p1  ORF type:complete len:467 (+),score=66.19 GFKZ01004941.1:341-1741(+)
MAFEPSSALRPLIRGTSFIARFSRVIDGDTIKVVLPGSSTAENIRILCLDTEETFAVSSKPVTPWGRAAKKFATSFFSDTPTVILEFPGNDPLDVSLSKHRDNYNRLLVYVYHNDKDFQQVMIEEGYSPYFNKYGNSPFPSHHLRYTTAERKAQIAGLGVWDQVSVNGSIIRNYPALTVWWHLRAAIIDEYRALHSGNPNIYNTRLDYAKLVSLAEEKAEATIFTEVRTVSRVAGSVGIVSIGSRARPFNLRIPDLDTDQGSQIVSLLNTRYISVSESFPRRSYCYVTGMTEMYRRTPQIVLTSANAVTDTYVKPGDVRIVPESRAADVEKLENEVDAVMTPVPDEEDVATRLKNEKMVKGGVVIASLLPNPVGSDAGNETVALKNMLDVEVDLEGWSLTDKVGGRDILSGNLLSGGELVVKLSGRGIRLNNDGDEVFLKNPGGDVVNAVSYSAADVVQGEPIKFS